MTYRDSRVTIGDISHMRVMGGTVANIRLPVLWRAHKAPATPRQYKAP